MPVLLLLNGLPGVGKSTVARLLADGRPMSLALDLDVLRGMLGGWLEDPSAAGAQTRRLALDVVARHLGDGHDVLVPQLVARPGFVTELADVAARTGARFLEVLLVTDRVRLLARLAARSARPERPEHHDAAVLLDRQGGPSSLLPVQERLDALVAGRPSTHVVRADDAERAAAQVRALLDG